MRPRPPRSILVAFSVSLASVLGVAGWGIYASVSHLKGDAPFSPVSTIALQIVTVLLNGLSLALVRERAVWLLPVFMSGMLALTGAALSVVAAFQRSGAAFAVAGAFAVVFATIAVSLAWPSARAWFDARATASSSRTSSSRTDA